jgi:hypothetical protein
MELFEDTFVPPGLEATWFALHSCPACGDSTLRPVKTLQADREACVACGACWLVSHGRLRPVDPVTCHGCAQRSRADCVRRLQRTFPRYGAGEATDAGTV